MKIAISIPDDISAWITQEAKKKQISRSRIIAHALGEYRQRQRNHNLLLKLNDALDGANESPSTRTTYRANHRRLIKNEDRF